MLVTVSELTMQISTKPWLHEVTVALFTTDETIVSYELKQGQKYTLLENDVMAIMFQVVPNRDPEKNKYRYYLEICTWCTPQSDTIALPNAIQA